MQVGLSDGTLAEFALFPASAVSPVKDLGHRLRATGGNVNQGEFYVYSFDHRRPFGAWTRSRNESRIDGFYPRLCRPKRESIEPVAAQLRSAHGIQVIAIKLDLSSIASVRS